MPGIWTEGDGNYRGEEEEMSRSCSALMLSDASSRGEGLARGTYDEIGKSGLRVSVHCRYCAASLLPCSSTFACCLCIANLAPKLCLVVLALVCLVVGAAPFPAILLILFVLKPLCIPLDKLAAVALATPRRDCVEEAFFFKNGDGRFSSSSMFQRAVVGATTFAFIVGKEGICWIEEEIEVVPVLWLLAYADMAVRDPADDSWGGAVEVLPAPGLLEGEGPIVAMEAEELLRFVGPSAALDEEGLEIIYALDRL